MNDFTLLECRHSGLSPGNEIVLAHANENGVSISDALRLYLHESDSSELLQRTLRVEYLSASWRKEFSEQV